MLNAQPEGGQAEGRAQIPLVFARNSRYACGAVIARVGAFDLLLISLVLWLAVGLAAQQNCPLPPALQPVTRERNMFTDQQESDLGDILADSLVEDEAVVEDAGLSEHLQGVAAQLVQYLPENHFRLQFFLIEIPEANAFSLPGGRIYVSRKLVATLRSDDELAAIVAHELGHVITHQGAIAMTELFRKVLGANSVGDRADIAEKIHRTREQFAMHKLHIRDTEESGELMADQVSLYTLTRAGYHLQAFPDALDRTADLHGKTGNWVTDLFHSTRQEQKRLRESIRLIGNTPASCKVEGSHHDTTEYSKWQQQVIAYKQPTRREQLSGVLFRLKLALPLRPNLFNIRFSQDGQYILAQDEGGIHVLAHDPLKDIFFIEASGAHKAFFTPDSKSIVFYTSDLRVEAWDVITQQRTSVYEMVLNTSCIQTALSLDGKNLACYDTNGTLWLFDTATGKPAFERKGFFHPTELGLLMVQLGAVVASEADTENPVMFVNLGFSPDGKYFLAGSDSLAGTEKKTLVYDMAEKRELPVGGGVREALTGPFVFLPGNRIATVDAHHSKSPIVDFPSGKKDKELPLNLGTHLLAPADGDFVIAGPVKDAALSVIDLKKNVSVARVKLGAVDIFNGVLAFEQGDGTLALLDLGSKTITGLLMLQQSRLSGSSAVAVSSNFKWLAASTKTRGATWDLTNNIRTHSLRSFNAGWFADDHSFYADFPKLGDQERAIFKFDPAGTGSQAFPAYPIGKIRAQQFGRYLLVTTPDAKRPGARNWTFELRDYVSKNTLWTHKFAQEYPAGYWDTDSARALLWWGTWESAAKEELKQYPELKNRADDNDYLFELLDLKNDSILRELLVKTNRASFVIKDTTSDGDWVGVTTKDDRVITYSLSSGKEVGHVFGYDPYISASANILVVPLSDTILNVYDLSTTEFRERLKFSAPVIFRSFSADGKRMFVMTSDQNVYVLDLTANALSASSPGL